MLSARLVAMIPGRGSLGGRALRAGGWSMAEVLTGHLFRLCSNLIMTRLLLPEAFGLMAMAVTVLTALTLFTDMGIQRSVTREPDGAEERFLRAAWVVKLGRGALVSAGVLGVAGLLWLLAPGLAAPGTVYADPRLPGLIALVALASLMQGAESTSKELLLRRLQPRLITLVGVAAQATGILSMIGFAQLSPTVWALLCGMLVNNAVLLLASHLVYPGPAMRPEWDRGVADRLWHYGKWLIGSSAFTFVARSADKLILASLLPAAAFGIYTIALIWVEAGRLLIARLIDRVGFAAMSEVLRTRPDEVRRLFGRFQAVIDLFCLAAFLAALLGGEILIRLLYTEAYHAAGGYLALLSLAFLVMRFEPLNGLVMNMGNSRAMMVVSVVRAVTICASVPLGFSVMGVEGAILAVALNPAVTAPYTLALTRPVLGLRQTVAGLLWLVATLALAIAILVVRGG